ncbi:4-demethylwyosine synthase TYW1 [Ignicoccus hospitalis]|uniref:4-demethylwyosine synthase TYW1 n=1 Tax=Ignicoccus hospitalis TaxID=160233 RepID=UPI001EE1E3FE|nr:4-demethylwyosine synthase TYW1 [Ignicoccus hospitalis]
MLRADVVSTILERLRKAGYHIVGSHSAVKKCHWTHVALTERRFCYKCKFYGIASHRCLQMTPAVIWCWLRCLHCWRAEPGDLGLQWDDTKLPTVDDPAFIAEKSIEEQRKIISGYKGHPKVDPKMFEEAMNPKHVAISLSGEPTLYPRLSELIEEYYKRGMTTFLVTHGVRPDALAELDPEPTQLYLSLEAWDEKSFKEFNRPVLPGLWSAVLQSLDILPSFSSPTVIRITLVKGFNDHERALEGLAKLVERGYPTYVEVKAYMNVGYSRYRLTKENMPTHAEVRSFAERLAEKIGYDVVDEQRSSRVVLLSRIGKPIRVGEGCPGGKAGELPEGTEYELSERVK